MLLSVESSLETEIEPIAKIEQVTNQKLFPSQELNLEEKSTDGANEGACLKNDVNFILTPFIYAKQKWLLTTGDSKRKSVEVFSTFLISDTFETTP